MMNPAWSKSALSYFKSSALTKNHIGFWNSYIGGPAISLKQADLAEANGIEIGDAHDAIADCKLMISLLEIINQKNFSIVNLSKLSEFKDSEVVNLDSLVKKKLLFKPKFPLKVLGNGEIKVKLKVQAHAFTKVAKEKIEAAGGSCEIINNK